MIFSLTSDTHLHCQSGKFDARSAGSVAFPTNPVASFWRAALVAARSCGRRWSQKAPIGAEPPFQGSR